MTVVAEEVQSQSQGTLVPGSTRMTPAQNGHGNRDISDDSLLEKDTQKRGRRLLEEVDARKKKAGCQTGLRQTDRVDDEGRLA
jgi:hypothetical protein